MRHRAPGAHTQKNDMKKNALLMFMAAILAAPAFASPPTVNPEQMDLDADINAKIGKEKAKKNGMSTLNAKGGAESADSKSGCVNVNINSNQQKSNSGIKDMFGKQTTTIVTGPVINMASCK
jgi:hypothetical protein